MKAQAKRLRYVIGVDEVGRGPIAGPVAVGAFVFLKPTAAKPFAGVKESKQLSEAQREAWFARILVEREKGTVDFVVSFQSEKVIDGPGLSVAIRRALRRSLAALEIAPRKALVLLDGGLKAPPEYEHQRTIIKGDAKINVIALASICAKALRDRRMNAFAAKHPDYGFRAHKGYGTTAHYAAIRTYGMLAIHRRSFLSNLR